jgi:hypothetical protein
MWASFRIAVPLLVLIVAIAFFAIPGCGCTTKDKAYVAAMKSDLRNVVTAQEMYFADSARYTDDLSVLRFTPSTGVTVRIFAASDSSWFAQSGHRNLHGTCAIYVGAVVPRPLAEVRSPGAEGEPYCSEARLREAR